MKLNENTKVTLTLGQLKKLIMESDNREGEADKSKKLYLVTVIKIIYGAMQRRYNKKVKAIDLKDALTKLQAGVKDFGPGGLFEGAVWVDDEGQYHAAGNNYGGVVKIPPDDIPVDTGDL